MLCPTCRKEVGDLKCWKSIQEEIFGLRKALRQEKLKVTFLSKRVERLKQTNTSENLLKRISMNNRQIDHENNQDEVICLD